MPCYVERLKLLNMEPLSSHFLKYDLMLFHKLVSNDIKIDTNFPIFSEIFITRTNPRGIYLSNSNKNVRNQFYLCRIAKLYLKLPNHIVLLPASQFRSAIDKFDVSSL